MSDYTLPAETRMGLVALRIRHLEPALALYQQTLGFSSLVHDDKHATLFAGNLPLLELEANPNAVRAGRHSGLYHYAIRVPDRPALGAVLERIIRNQVRVHGFSDHGVSEAIYLPDSDGIGIEIYRDRPRETWYDAAGNLRMDTAPLDIEDLLAQRNGSAPHLPEGTVIGHVHLHVAYLRPAVEFYRTLGFDLVGYYGDSAAFVSAGGYHHHIGMNTWAGEGVEPPPAEAIGLRHFTIELPDEEALTAFTHNLEKQDIPYEAEKDSLWLDDPSRNRIRVTCTSPTTSKDYL